MTAQETAPADTARDVYTVMGREVRLPVEVRDASAAVAYYLVPSRAVERLLPTRMLRVAELFPGRTLCTIGAIDYRDNDLGRYHEIGVTFFVAGPGERPLPLLGTALGLLRGGLSAYIHTLPVDGEFTCEAGRSIWGFPKFVTEIDISRTGDTETAELRADGQLVLRQSMRASGTRSFPARRQISYSYRDGVLFRTPSLMQGEGVRAGRGGASLELGPHPLGDELRSLGLPKRPLFTTHLGKMTGRFFAAERIEQAGR